MMKTICNLLFNFVLLSWLWVTSLQALEVEVDSYVKAYPGLKEEIVKAAQAKVQGEPASVFIGNISGFGLYGARVVFEPKLAGIEGEQATYTVCIPTEQGERLNNGAVIRSFVKGQWTDEKTYVRKIQAFPLKTAKLYLELDKETDYQTALSLLQAIEKDEFRGGQSTHTQTKVGDKIRHQVTSNYTAPDPARLGKVDRVRYNPQTGEYTVHMAHSPSSADVYTFVLENGRFRCTGSSQMWV